MCHLFSAGNTDFTNVNIIIAENPTYLGRLWKPDAFIRPGDNKKVRIILKNRNACQNILVS